MAFAAVMLAEGNDATPQQVANARAGGGEITLKQPIPVHMTYFTAVANAEGHVSTYADIYGHDSRLAAALTGRTLKLDPALDSPPDDAIVADDSSPGPGTTKKGKKKVYKGPDTLADAITGFWMN
jgi:hypothetical protein